MTLFDRVQVLLPHGMILLRPHVDLAGAVHGQGGGFVRDDQPFHAVDVRLTLAVVFRVALEDRLDVRLIALQDEGSSADDGLGFLEVPVLLRHLRGHDPRAPRIGQGIDQPHKRLFEEELHRIAVHHLDPVHGLQQEAVGIGLFGQEAVIGEFHILGDELAAVEGGLIRLYRK